MAAERAVTAGAGEPASRLREFAELLRQATGEDARWAELITPETRLDDDLHLESVEWTALGELVRHRYGDSADLPAYLAGLDLDQLIALRVADLLAFVRAA